MTHYIKFNNLHVNDANTHHKNRNRIKFILTNLVLDKHQIVHKILPADDFWKSWGLLFINTASKINIIHYTI